MLAVALGVSLICSVVVSTAAIGLKPLQDANVLLDMQRNVLAAAGIPVDERGVADIFAQEFEQYVVDLRSGAYMADMSPAVFDQLEMAKDEAHSIALDADQDTATLRRRENYGMVYLRLDAAGAINRVVLPIRGYGLWGTLYGYLALEGDLRTVAGIGFYQHKETPGLGGEVDNPKWRALWVGKGLYGTDGEPAIRLVKGASASPYEVDALAGATITSRGVESLVRFWSGEMGYGPFLKRLADEHSGREAGG